MLSKKALITIEAKSLEEENYIFKGAILDNYFQPARQGLAMIQCLSLYSIENS